MGPSHSKHGVIADQYFYDAKSKKTYIVINSLGSGGFGSVFKVFDKDTKKEYALKHVKGLSQNEVEDALKEALTLQRINEENVIKHIHSFIVKDRDKTDVCIVMELVKGKNLEKIFESMREPCNPVWAMTLFIQIIDTLARLHEHNIIHRDIKPANIIISIERGFPVVKIVDFGLACEVSRFSGTLNTRCGTIVYLPPEVLNSNYGRISNKVDIWAVGLILYQALTLDDGFLKSNFGWSSYVGQHPDIIHTNIPDISFRRLLIQMLEMNPERRISSRELINSDLIIGWKHLLYPSPTNKRLDTAQYYMAFISALEPTSPDKHLAESLSILQVISKSRTHRSALVKLQLVQKLAKLIELPNLLPKNIRGMGIEIEDKSFVTQNTKIDASIANNHAGVLNMLKNSDIDVVSIQILKEFLTCSQTRVIAASLIYSSNLLGILVQKFKQLHAGMDSIMFQLCRIPFIQRILREEYGLEYILLSMMNEHTRYSMQVFQKLSFYSSPQALPVFLNHLTQRSRKSIIARTTEVFYNYHYSHLLITNSSFDLWKACFNKLTSNEITPQFLASLVRIVLPLEDIVQYVVNNQQCTKILGTFILTQLMYPQDALCFPCYIQTNRSTDSLPLHILGCCTNKNGNDLGVKSPSLSHETNTNMIAVEPSSHTMEGVYRFYNDLGITFKIDNSIKQTSCHLLTFAGFIIKETNIPVQSYFEVYIQKAPSNMNGGTIAIGLAPEQKSNVSNHLLGWMDNECAYHNDDGNVFTGHITKTAGYAVAYGSGDVIGCGITGDRRVFYTINGTFLGFVKTENRDYKVKVGSRIVSCVGVTGNNFKVSIHFKDFMYKTKYINDLWSVNNLAIQLIFKSSILAKDIFEFLSKHSSVSNLEAVSVLMRALETSDNDLYNNIVKQYPISNNLSQNHCPKFFNEISLSSKQNIIKQSSYIESDDIDSILSQSFYDSTVSPSDNKEPQEYHEFGVDSLLFDSSPSPFNIQEEAMLNKKVSPNSIQQQKNEKEEDDEDDEDDIFYAITEEIVSPHIAKNPITIFICFDNRMNNITIVGEISITKLKNACISALGLPTNSRIKIYILEDGQKFLNNNQDIIDIVPKGDDEYPILNIETF